MAALAGPDIDPRGSGGVGWSHGRGRILVRLAPTKRRPLGRASIRLATLINTENGDGRF